VTILVTMVICISDACRNKMVVTYMLEKIKCMVKMHMLSMKCWYNYKKMTY